MLPSNFSDKINLYLKSNPRLSHNDFGTLLLIDSLYKLLPDDLGTFRKLYSHLDPRILDDSQEGIIFLNIAASKEPTSVIKHRLNNYINMKFNYIRNSKSYEENMVQFKEISVIISHFLDEILSITRFPDEILAVLSESKVVRECLDFYQMLRLFRATQSKRIRYEILRKLGLLVLYTRIHRSFLIDDLDFAVKELSYVFTTGLGLSEKKERVRYLWVDEHDKAHHMSDKRKAFEEYQDSVKRRNNLALPIYSMQVIKFTPWRTKFNSVILNMEIRNQLRNLIF